MQRLKVTPTMKQMLRHILPLLLLLTATGYAFAYDFSSVAPSGQTLYYAFYGNDVQVTYPGNYSNWAYWSGYTQPTGALTIPASVSYNGTTYAVTTIGEYAFWGCSGITSVTLPSSVTSLNDDAFEGCSSIASVTIPTSVEHIGKRVFSCCYALTHVTIPSSVSFIGNAAFTGCSGLTSVDFNADSCTFMGASANPVFSNCYDLATVTIGSNVRNIPTYAFKACSGLTSVTISDQVANIGNYAFWGCSSLTSVTIPHAVAHIGNYAFSGCSSLTSVVFNADSCLSMGNHTYPSFYNCNQITSVTVGSNVKVMPAYAFYSCNNIDTIYALGDEAPSLGVDAIHEGAISKVPCVAVDLYLLAGWPNVTNADPVPEYQVDASDEAMGEVEVLLIPTCPTRELSVRATPRTGYHFIQWSDGSTDNPYTLTLTQDTTLTALFGIDTLHIEATANNDQWGSVSGSGDYTYGETVTLTATPNEGYLFVGWSNDTVDNPYVFEAVEDLVLTAVFAPKDTTGIADIENVPFVVTVLDGYIQVTGTRGEVVRLFDVAGRQLGVERQPSDRCRFRVPAPGVYLVQVGNHPAKKLVAIQ